MKGAQPLGLLLTLPTSALGLAFAVLQLAWAAPKNDLPPNLKTLNLAHYKAVVLRKLPHPKPNYTQGLVFYSNFLYESTGLRGGSSLKKIDPKTGKVIRFKRMSSKYFAEGLAVHDDVLVQLTWTSEKAFWYKAERLSRFKSVAYEGEGWGLSTWPQGETAYWVMSDGSPILKFRNIKGFEVERWVRVHWPREPGSNEDNSLLLENINELEVVFPIIYANVWRENWIAMIDGHSGVIVGVVDCSDLNREAKSRKPKGGKKASPSPSLASKDNVLNGIAYQPTTKHFYITGKRWRWIYEAVFKKVDGP